MYLAEVKLWNYRKYGINGDDYETSLPGVSVSFNEGLNVLIGENDSGKTAIIDAIRYTVGTLSKEWIQLEDSDFHCKNNVRSEKKLKIECVFRGFKDKEAAHFLEWMGFEEIEGKQHYVLNIRLTGLKKTNRIIYDLRGGPDPLGIPIDGEARERLRVAYLKPLRDAENELTPGRRSRFAQILAAHSVFQKKKDEQHRLEEIIQETNKAIGEYFDPDIQQADGREIIKSINSLMKEFFPKNEFPSSVIKVSGAEIADILRRLELAIQDNPAGLGTLNRLYIAAELILLQSPDYAGLRLSLIEELEAHLHPQAQLHLIQYLQNQSNIGQFILSTHSTILGASISLENLIICKGDKVFPMGIGHTKLEPMNYGFLQRFLDATKANLFFSRGVILVEGDAENLLLPTIAEIIDRPLHRYGVSIVNVGSTAFLHYARIFNRKDGPDMGIKVAVITDMDIKPLESHLDEGGEPPSDIDAQKATQKKVKEAAYNSGDVKAFVSPNWTLEYEIALSKLRKIFYTSVLWAEKISNSKTGVPKETKWEEVKETTDTNLKEWTTKFKGGDRSREKIAYEIYKNTLVDKDISKAITAQVFAEQLKDIVNKKSELRDCLIAEESLRYLIDAICYVTEALE